jgi:protein-disulfide isomerase
MQRSERVNTVATVLITICAVISTIMVVGRVRQKGPGPLPGPRNLDEVTWEELAGGRDRIGPRDAPVTIVEFADFECPFCRRFATATLKGLETHYPQEIAVVFRHWPLAYHRLAYPAARAAECAAEQGRFAQFYDILYAGQDSLGLEPFARFAVKAGVPDSTQFERCNSNTAPVTIIERDIALAKRVGARGTPTLAVNGTLYYAAPDSIALDQIVGRVLAERR